MGSNRELRVVIAGGGTGGHVLPAVAVHDELKRRNVGARFLWIGSHNGVERQEAERAGIPFRAIQTGKLRRYIDPKTVPDMARIPVGALQAAGMLLRFHPDVVFSTGGFVSVPTVYASRFLAPVITHEQTAIVGLANRLNAKVARVLAVSYASTADAACRMHRNVVLTGNPVRKELRAGAAERARAHFGFREELPVVVVTGGARGASALNQRLFELLTWLLERAQVVHQTGDPQANPDLADAERRRAALPVHLRARYQPRGFLGPELIDLYALADLIVGRAGAGTVAELAYVGKPSILIPLPLSGGGEQERNADILAAAGAAIVIPQSEATAERLQAELAALLGAPIRLAEMARAARALGNDDAAGALADQILALARR